jgi:hypothetical protein
MGFDRLTDLHDDWIRDMVFGTEDATLQAARGTYKTTCVSVALALIAILYPNLRTAFIRKTDSDVKEIMAQTRRMLETPEAKAFSELIWGHQVKVTTNNQSEISTNLTNDPRGSAQITGMGTSGSITGKHYDRIFTDDIVNPKDRVSRAERERTRLVYQELQNIKNRDGRIYNTGTPWHVDDAFELMPSPRKFDCYSVGMFTEEEIQNLREHMEPSLFAANYELRHIPSDNLLFVNPKKGADQQMVANGRCHVDAAYYGDDWTAFTAARYVDGKYYVYGRCWRKHVDDCMDEITSEYQRLMLGKLWMEINADKGYSARVLKERGVRTVTYSEHQNKHVKIVTYLKGVWPDVVFCDGTDEEYINQICDYTEDAEHDDCPDSLASLIRIIGKKKDGDYKPLWAS